MALLLLVGIGLVVAGVMALLLLRRGPRLGDDWPRIAFCSVKERTGPEGGGWPAYPQRRRLKEITPREYRTLCALCDTLVPAFADPEEVKRGAKVYLTELLGEDGATPALLEEVTRDMGFYTYGALEAGVPLKVADVLEEHVPPDSRRIFRMVLKALEMPVSLFVLTGQWHGWHDGGFSSLPFRQRERVFSALLVSWAAPMRGLALFLKAMTGRTYFGSRGRGEGSSSSSNGNGNKTGSTAAAADTDDVNPTWNALRYEDRTEATVKKVAGGKPLRAPQLKPLAKQDVPPSSVGGGTDVRELNCDVVIVGSGAGGGTCAGVLCQAGLDVVVLEKGGYYTERDFAKWGELDGDKGLYERSGWLASEELSISLLAGSCVGGGTTLNWCASFRTPRHVRKDWVERRGLKSFADPAYDQALDAVCRRTNVNTRHSHRNDECASDVPDLVVNPNNEALWQGAKAVGARCYAIPRNVKGCRDCSGCERGCPYSAKQSTMNTFLEDAQATGKMRLVARAHVDKVLRNDHGEAVGVIATVQDGSDDDKGGNGGGNGNGEKKPYQLIVWAEKAVVVAAGSLHTPALLLRSGLAHPKIGRHLALHPVAAVGGFYPGTHFQTHRGIGMGTYVPATMAGKEEDGWGGAIETPPSHAGLSGVVVPWSSAFHYRLFSLLKGQYAVNIVISRDASSAANRVAVDEAGRPRVHYLLTGRDKANLQHSVGTMLRMMKETGAVVALPINEGFRTWRRHREGNKGFGEYLQYLEGLGSPVANTQLFTAHQMCSCRMGATEADGPVDETGRLWEAPNLYVMDASVFPTSLGINPMITIEAIAYMNARRLARALAGEDGVKKVDARYGQPTPEEAKGIRTFPEGDTLRGEYGVACGACDW